MVVILDPDGRTVSDSLANIKGNTLAFDYNDVDAHGQILGVCRGAPAVPAKQ
jgi:hypothetical protein